MKIIYYIVPFFPVYIRLIFSIVHFKYLNENLSNDEKDRTEIRSHVLSLGGFSFTALIALSVLEPNIQQNLQLSIYYIFISFLCYLFALNLQGYKTTRLHEIISDAMIETASLCLILTIVSILFITKLDVIFVYLLSTFAILIWFIDMIIRVNILEHYYDNLKKKEN